MFCNPDIMPSDPTVEVKYLGGFDKVEPPFNEDNWYYAGIVKAERTLAAWQGQDESWVLTSEVTPEIDPGVEGFWMWGDVLVRVVPATILESGLYFFRRKEATNG